MVLLVLCSRICCSISVDVVRIGTRMDMYGCVDGGAGCVLAWWEAVDVDLSDDVRARLDVFVAFVRICCGCWLLT